MSFISHHLNNMLFMCWEIFISRPVTRYMCSCKFYEGMLTSLYGGLFSKICQLWREIPEPPQWTCWRRLVDFCLNGTCHLISYQLIEAERRIRIIVSVNWAIIGADNGLSSDRHQAIIWTNVGILLIEPRGTNFNEILIEIHTILFNKIHLKM